MNGVHVGDKLERLRLFMQDFHDELVVVQVDDQQVENIADVGWLEQEFLVFFQLVDGDVGQIGIQQLSARVQFKHPIRQVRQQRCVRHHSVPPKAPNNKRQLQTRVLLDQSSGRDVDVVLDGCPRFAHQGHVAGRQHRRTGLDDVVQQQAEAVVQAFDPGSSGFWSQPRAQLFIQDFHDDPNRFLLSSA